MKIWITGKKFDENTIPPKEAFYSKLNVEGISNVDYAYAQKVWEVFRLKTRSEYYDLCTQGDTLLLADVFENFRDKCNEIYELDPVYFVSAPGLAWQACLKKTGVKLELLTDYDMLLMVEKGIRGGICQATHRYAKANNKYLKNYNKSIESSYLAFLEANNLYGWAMSQKSPVNCFKWKKKNLSKFNEDFMKKYDEDSNTGYFLEVDVEYPETFKSHKDLQFLLEKKRLKKSKNLFVVQKTKKNMLPT